MAFSKHYIIIGLLLLVTNSIKAQCIVLMYPFNGNSQDSSTHQFNASVQGATLTKDRFGNPNSAYQFDGIDDFLDAGNIIDLSQHNALTISAWFAIDTTDNNNIRHTGISIGTKSSGELLLRSGYPADNKFQAGLFSGIPTGSNVIGNSTKSDSTYSFNKWYHVVGIYRNDQVELWVNGVQQSDSTRNNGGTVLSTVPSSADLWIGKSTNPNKNKFFKGKIDDVVVLSCAADSATIQALYQNLPLPFCLDTTVSGFTHNANSGNVSFTSTSQHAHTYLWDFGDGNTSNVANPIHTYQNSGTFNACLIASNDCFYDTICQTVSVCRKVAKADFLSQNRKNLHVQFYQKCTNAVSFLWNFGDGNYSKDPDPIYAFTDTGYYDVCLTVNDSCGQTDTYCQKLDLHNTSLQENELLQRVLVYPNPSNNYLYLEFPFESNEAIEVTIYDISGKVLTTQLSTKTSLQTIDLGSYQTGIYILTIKVGVEKRQFKIVKS